MVGRWQRADDHRQRNALNCLHWEILRDVDKMVH